MSDRLSHALLYGIFDTGYANPADAALIVERMVAGGVDVIQVRAKGWEEEDVEGLAGSVAEVLSGTGVPLILNDFPQLVPSVGADGAHVGQEDHAVADARWRAGRALAGEVPPVLIGKSTHALAQAEAAQAEGADYIGFGPLYPTPTKAGRPAIGLEEIAEVHRRVTVPIFCIGGVKRENLEAVLGAGARRVVIVSGILLAPDLEGYCRDVKTELLRNAGLD
jgi:thiamine-phosphate pyrophosphorylase